MAEWPIISIEDTLYHVGTMNPANKGIGSYEGHGLSISRDPDDWRSIAKLPGSEWVLEKPGHSFLDVHELTDEQKAVIFGWAVGHGLCERTVIFQSVRYDDEWECDLASTHATYEEAIEQQGWEIDGDGNVIDDDGEPVDEETLGEHIRQHDSFAATPALIEMMRGNNHDSLGSSAEQYAIIAYAERVLGLDGCWWEDEHDPSRLTCPRGVIFPERLSSWKVCLASEHEANLDEEMTDSAPSP